MTIKYFFCIIFLWTSASFGQVTHNGTNLAPKREMSSKKLLLKKKNKIEYINQNSEIEVYLKQSDITVKGKFIITADSTIEINHKAIPLKHIQRIKVRENTRTEGIFLSGMSTTFIVGGVYFFYRASESSDIWNIVGNGIIGTFSGALGLFTIPPAIVLTSNNTYNYYNSEKWEISITD